PLNGWEPFGVLLSTWGSQPKTLNSAIPTQQWPGHPEAAGPLTPLITRRCAFRSSRNQSRVPARRRSPCDSRVRANRHRPCTATAACRSTAPHAAPDTSSGPRPAPSPAAFPTAPHQSDRHPAPWHTRNTCALLLFVLVGTGHAAITGGRRSVITGAGVGAAASRACC